MNCNWKKGQSGLEQLGREDAEMDKLCVGVKQGKTVKCRIPSKALFKVHRSEVLLCIYC